MKLSGFKRLRKEDFPKDYQELVDKLAYSINTFTDEVINGLNKNLTIDENMNQFLKEITVTVNSSGVPTETTQLTNALAIPAKGMKVLRAENLTNTSSYPTNAPFISFSEEKKVITIKHVTGLQASNKYKLLLNVIGN